MSMGNSKPTSIELGSLDRRSFLKLGAISTALPGAASAEVNKGATAPTSGAGQGGAVQGELLPPLPKLADLASDRLVHHFRDLFNPPAAQNEWGYLQATKSVSGITAISFPPFICCGTPAIPFTPGDLVTCELFLNDQILYSHPYPAGEVAFTWYPHRIVRETLVQGIRFTTQTSTSAPPFP
jgi:hypothetical protein